MALAACDFSKQRYSPHLSGIYSYFLQNEGYLPRKGRSRSAQARFLRTNGAFVRPNLAIGAAPVLSYGLTQKRPISNSPSPLPSLCTACAKFLTCYANRSMRALRTTRNSSPPPAFAGLSRRCRDARAARLRPSAARPNSCSARISIRYTNLLESPLTDSKQTLASRSTRYKFEPVLFDGCRRLSYNSLRRAPTS